MALPGHRGSLSIAGSNLLHAPLVPEEANPPPKGEPAMSMSGERGLSQQDVMPRVSCFSISRPLPASP